MVQVTFEHLTEASDEHRKYRLLEFTSAESARCYQTAQMHSLMHTTDSTVHAHFQMNIDGQWWPRSLGDISGQILKKEVLLRGVRDGYFGSV